MKKRFWKKLGTCAVAAAMAVTGLTACKSGGSSSDSDSVDTVKTCLAITAEMLRTATVLKDNMLAAGKKGFINATDVADYLVKKGEAFRSAYKITGQLVAEAIAKNATLEELPLKEYQKYSPLFKEDIYGAIDLKNCVEKRTSFGGPAKDSVLAQIERVEEFLKGKK